MMFFRSTFCALVLGSVLIGCDAAEEPLSYCADVQVLDAQLDCMNDSFEFYGKLVDSTQSYVQTSIEESIATARNAGQVKKYERLLAEQASAFDWVVAELAVLELSTETLVTVSDESNQSSIFVIETDASELIAEFDRVSQANMRKL